MTDRSKFEQMLEYLINEDEQKAKEIFHDIVVEKSREIYESLLENDFADPEALPGEEPADGPAMEAGDDMGGDAADDMLGDIEDDGDDMGGDEFGGEEGDDVNLSGSDVDELQDRVVDLEDALDALRDEFESLMGAEEGDMGGDESDSEVPEDDMMAPPADAQTMEGSDDEEEEEEEESRADEEFIREYVEKVTAKMGDNGANTKSVVAGKNDMGGTTANIAKGGVEGKGGTQGGLLNPSTKDLNSGNVNVPGGKAGVKHLKTVSAGHGAEKKGSKPDSEKSLLGK